MSTAKRPKKKVVRASKTPPESAKPKRPMVERKVDPDAPYFGLSKEEFERLTPWRKVPLNPEMEKLIDWIIANRRAIRGEGELPPYEKSEPVPSNGESL